jgi:hypothetical protein
MRAKELETLFSARSRQAAPISPIVGYEACVVVDWAGFGNYARQSLIDARK